MTWYQVELIYGTDRVMGMRIPADSEQRAREIATDETSIPVHAWTVTPLGPA